MSRSIRRRWFGVPALAAAILCTVLVGTAFAAGNSISQVAVPAHAKVNKQFSITITGHAAKKATLYMFLDGHPCGSSPATEHARRAFGLFGSINKGNFRAVVKHLAVKNAVKVHVCTYLVKASEPKDSSKGVLAHHFASFRVR